MCSPELGRNTEMLITLAMTAITIAAIAGAWGLTKDALQDWNREQGSDGDPSPTTL